MKTKVNAVWNIEFAPAPDECFVADYNGGPLSISTVVAERNAFFYRTIVANFDFVICDILNILIHIWMIST